MLTENELNQSAKLVQKMAMLFGTSHVVYQGRDADGEALPIVVAEACPEDDHSSEIEPIELCRCESLAMADLIAGLVNDAPELLCSLAEQMERVRRCQEQIVALSDAIDDALSFLRGNGELSASRAEESLTAGVYEAARVLIGEEDLDEAA